MKKLAAPAAIVVTLTLTMSACSGSDSAADAHVDQLDANAEAAAMDRFSTFKDDLSSITSYHAQGTLEAEDGNQYTDFVFDRSAGAFEGTASIESGSVDMTIDLIRASNLLWIKGPAEYWESFGYDATPAIGKYVVFQAAQGDQVAKTYDYDRLVSTVETISNGQVTVEGEVDEDGTDFIRYALGEKEKSTLLDIPATGEMGTAKLVSTTDEVDATIVIDEFGTNTDISAPAPVEVTQPQGQ
ncbi:hypothetical protein [Brevibacterium aurantiacum]|uniref:Lipoprotein n=1 Tax=Brevibacterium aurantiacum TaxID=273384 RepID=A0A556CBS1_BREAU|nr:hypothetical protein [Brevibacterium aurantiacum]TSI14905.1 hypothetical protein FO013_12725 [Brevibacterium aurantiacum]